MDANELKRREDALVEEIVKGLPEFVRMCDQNVEVVMLHQDAFAAAYQDEEYRLLGWRSSTRAYEVRKFTSSGRIAPR